MVPAPSADVPPADVVHVVSDLPLARLSIGERVVAGAVGLQEIAVPLEADELSKRLRVEGRSATGRRATTFIAPGARSAELRFALPPPTAASRPNSGDRPLARSPYEGTP